MLWALANSAHHDLAVLPSGDIYVLTRHVRRELPSFEGSLLLENGHMLYFDNEEGSGASVVREIDLQTNREV